eukprot:COSAG02_NODE_25028_length_670_cov_18.115587_1_plen_223_part_11
MIPTQECSGGDLTSGVNGNRQDHCSGFANAGDGGYILGGYYLGGNCRAALYDMDTVIQSLAGGVEQARECEGNRLTITCSGDDVINIIDATYGRRHGPEVCPHPATTDQNCHAIESSSIVSATCQGVSTCSVSVANDVFGDPCGGTYKYLTVDYECMSPAEVRALEPPADRIPFQSFELNVCYKLRSATLDAVMHEEGATGDCSGGDPIFAQTSGRADSFKFV